MIESWDLFRDLFPGVAVKLGTALLCGLLLGLERERKNKPAGLRTVLLITLGSTLFMIVSDLIPIMTRGPASITRADPSRVASEVVSGIGFLGAGVILQARGSIHGLTTAAVIWVAAGIGLCIGVGFPLLGILITVAVLVMLIGLAPLRAWLGRHGETRTLELLIPNDTLSLHRIEHVLRQHDVHERNISFSPYDDAAQKLQVDTRLSGAGLTFLLEALARVEGVRGVPVVR